MIGQRIEREQRQKRLAIFLVTSGNMTPSEVSRASKIPTRVIERWLNLSATECQRLRWQRCRKVWRELSRLPNWDLD